MPSQVREWSVYYAPYNTNNAGKMGERIERDAVWCGERFILLL